MVRANRFSMDRLVHIILYIFFKFFEENLNSPPRLAADIMSQSTTGFAIWEEARVLPLDDERLPLAAKGKLSQAFQILDQKNPWASAALCGVSPRSGRERCTCNFWKQTGKRCSHLWSMLFYERVGDAAKYQAEAKSYSRIVKKLKLEDTAPARTKRSSSGSRAHGVDRVKEVAEFFNVTKKDLMRWDCGLPPEKESSPKPEPESKRKRKRELSASDETAPESSPGKKARNAPAKSASVKTPKKSASAKTPKKPAPAKTPKKPSPAKTRKKPAPAKTPKKSASAKTKPKEPAQRGQPPHIRSLQQESKDKSRKRQRQEDTSEPQTESSEPRTKSSEPRTESSEPRTKSSEPRTDPSDPRTDSSEPDSSTGTPQLTSGVVPPAGSLNETSIFCWLNSLLAALSACPGFVDSVRTMSEQATDEQHKSLPDLRPLYEHLVAVQRGGNEKPLDTTDIYNTITEWVGLERRVQEDPGFAFEEIVREMELKFDAGLLENVHTHVSFQTICPTKGCDHNEHTLLSYSSIRRRVYWRSRLNGVRAEIETSMVTHRACPKCGTMIEVDAPLIPLFLPQIATVQYHYSEELIWKSVTTPWIMNIPEKIALGKKADGFVGDNMWPKYQTYSLVSAVLRRGVRVDKGHNTSVVKKDGQWFHINDTRVTEVASPNAPMQENSTKRLVVPLMTFYVLDNATEGASSAAGDHDSPLWIYPPPNADTLEHSDSEGASEPNDNRDCTQDQSGKDSDGSNDRQSSVERDPKAPDWTEGTP